MGGMEGMGEMVYLVLVDPKDREEKWDLRDHTEVEEKRGSKVPVVHKD